MPSRIRSSSSRGAAIAASRTTAAATAVRASRGNDLDTYADDLAELVQKLDLRTRFTSVIPLAAAKWRGRMSTVATRDVGALPSAREARRTEPWSLVEEPSLIDQTPPMKFHRIAIAWLLTIALPYSVAASVFDAGACHHASKAAHAHASMHHDHAAMVMAHSHHIPATPASHDNCDCPLQCDCASPCSGGGWSSVAVRQSSNSRTWVTVLSASRSLAFRPTSNTVLSSDLPSRCLQAPLEASSRPSDGAYFLPV